MPIWLCLLDCIQPPTSDHKGLCWCRREIRAFALIRATVAMAGASPPYSTRPGKPFQSCIVGATLAVALSHQLKAGCSVAPPQGDRQGRPYYMTDQPTKPVYSRGGAGPRPGAVRAILRSTLKLVRQGVPLRSP